MIGNIDFSFRILNKTVPNGTVLNGMLGSRASLLGSLLFWVDDGVFGRV